MDKEKELFEDYKNIIRYLLTNDNLSYDELSLLKALRFYYEDRLNLNTSNATKSEEKSLKNFLKHINSHNKDVLRICLESLKHYKNYTTTVPFLPESEYNTYLDEISFSKDELDKILLQVILETENKSLYDFYTSYYLENQDNILEK